MIRSYRLLHRRVGRRAPEPELDPEGLGELQRSIWKEPGPGAGSTMGADGIEICVAIEGIERVSGNRLEIDKMFVRLRPVQRRIEVGLLPVPPSIRFRVQISESRLSVAEELRHLCRQRGRSRIANDEMASLAPNSGVCGGGHCGDSHHRHDEGNHREGSHESKSVVDAVR
jgi:hypothetical protein